MSVERKMGKVNRTPFMNFVYERLKARGLKSSFVPGRLGTLGYRFNTLRNLEKFLKQKEPKALAYLPGERLEHLALF